MGFVFAALALVLGLVAFRLDRDDRALRAVLLAGATLNGLALVFAVASGDPWAWSLRPAIEMAWW